MWNCKHIINPISMLHQTKNLIQFQITIYGRKINWKMSITCLRSVSHVSIHLLSLCNSAIFHKDCPGKFSSMSNSTPDTPRKIYSLLPKIITTIGSLSNHSHDPNFYLSNFPRKFCFFYDIFTFKFR